MKTRISIGVALIAIAIIGVFFVPQIAEQTKVPTTPTATPIPQQDILVLVPGHLEPLLEDAEYQKLMKDRYGLTIRYRIMSDQEMMSAFTGQGRNRLQGVSAMMSTTELVMDRIHKIDAENKEKANAGQQIDERETFYTYSATVMSSPLVFLTWDDIADAFVREGIVTKQGETFYVTDMVKLLSMIDQGQQWSTLGLPYHGDIKIIPTDPTQSGSGLAWAAIVTDVLLRGKTYTLENVQPVQPSINRIIPKRFLESDPKALLDKYVSQGAGTYPIIVGFENQLTEYAIARPQAVDQIRSQMRVLYPRPTVFSPHPVITKDDGGRDWANAMRRDPDIRRIAWQKHGFRTDAINVNSEADKSVISILGIPDRITSSVGIPPSNIMDTVINSWKNSN